LQLKFGDNLLKENNAFELLLDKQEDLAGLPESVISAAKEAAEAKGYNGKWLITLDNPSRIPFLTYSDRRDLREKLYKGYLKKGDNNNENDNKKNIVEIMMLRQEKAKMLGYKNYAEYVIDENMAKTPEKVFEMLNKVWAYTLPVMKKEAQELQKMIKADGKNFKLQGWDWWYYSEKLRKAKYDLDEEALKPYFKLENVRDGMFMLANKLYGITFEPIKNAPVYHNEATAYEVKDADGSLVGVYFMDPFPRSSKRGGAWMTNFRDQYIKDGKETRPIVMNVCNFTKPTGDTPSLLTLDEVLTMFHEFGHGLHGLLSDCHYRSLSGTAVPRDFVEFGSQIMENWATAPEMLKLYAKHYKTGEPMPDELIQKIENSQYFNQGFTTGEYTAAALLDMYWHTNTDIDANFDVNAYEQKIADEIGLIPEVAFRYRSTYFSHSFTGEYSAGYYVYQWAAVIEADAFQAFKEKGLFDRTTGQALRDKILSKGSTEEAMKMYVDFRGKEPSIDPFLRRLGFIK
jgi:peptidyl-dipeptidase Dcp